MKIMPISDSQDKKITALIHGRQGSGKSLLASTVATNIKTLLVDTPMERGIETLRTLPYSNNIDVVQISRLSDMNDVYNMLNLEKHSYGAVIIDSWTGLQTVTNNHICEFDKEEGLPDLENDLATLTQPGWGKMLNVMSLLIDKFFALADKNREQSLHVIGVTQSNVRGDRLDPKEDKELLIAPAIQGASYDRLLAAPDYVFYTFIEEDYEAFGDEPKMKYLVRIGPHPQIVTKIRTDLSINSKIPPVVGHKSRVTLDKLVSLFGKTL